MPNSADLKADGYIPLAELVEAVAAQVRHRASYVADLLPSRLTKVKAAMVFADDVVQPDDYKVKHLYHNGLVPYVAQMWKLAEFGRVSLVDAVDLYKAYKKGSQKAMDELVASITSKQEGQKKRPRKRKHLRVAS
jgi:hypothetical protein